MKTNFVLAGNNFLAAGQSIGGTGNTGCGTGQIVCGKDGTGRDSLPSRILVSGMVQGLCLIMQDQKKDLIIHRRLKTLVTLFFLNCFNH